MEKTLKVPYIKQWPYYCGPACLEMVLRYHGIEKTQDEIGREISPVPYFGYTTSQLKEYAEKQGFQATLTKHSNITELIKNIDAEIPTIILQWLNIEKKQPHFRVAIGHKENKITVRDPELSPEILLPESLLNYFWDINGKKIALAIQK
ncbi:MAG: C39 family peptidase [archaeon]